MVVARIRYTVLSRRNSPRVGKDRWISLDTGKVCNLNTTLHRAVHGRYPALTVLARRCAGALVRWHSVLCAIHSSRVVSILGRCSLGSGATEDIAYKLELVGAAEVSPRPSVC